MEIAELRKMEEPPVWVGASLLHELRAAGSAETFTLETAPLNVMSRMATAKQVTADGATLDFSKEYPVTAGSKLRKAVEEAFKSPTAEDSEVQFVLLLEERSGAMFKKERNHRAKSTDALALAARGPEPLR